MGAGMILERTFYLVECDNCGFILKNICVDRYIAITAAKACGWEHNEITGEESCPQCHLEAKEAADV